MRLPFRKEKALTGTPAVLEAMSMDWSPYPLLGGGQRQRVLEAFNTAKSANYAWLYKNSPSVRMVIDCMVRNAGQLDNRLYEEVSQQERQPKPDHPAALSMRYPSEGVSADKFIRQMFKDFLIYDDAAAVMSEAPGRQITLNWVPFSQMELRGNSLFAAETYRYSRPDGSWVDFPAERVMHWHGENPQDPRIGLSHLDTLRDVIAEEVALRQAITELGNSGLTEAIWAYRPVEAPVITSRDAVGAMEEDLTNKMRRRNRKVPVLQEGTELRSFGVNPRDAQMLELRHAILVQVSAEYGLPLGMLAESPTSDARNVFIDDCLAPLCENFTRFLNQRVLVQVYNWTDGTFEFYLDEKRMGTDTLKALTSATGRPVLLTNEARAMVNRPPVDGGDELVTPSNVIVGDNPKPSVDVMPIQDPNGPEQDGSFRETMLDFAQAVEKAIAGARNFDPVGARKELDDPTAGGHDEATQVVLYDPKHRGDRERAHAIMDAMKAPLGRHLGRLARSLGAQKAATDWERWNRELSDDLDPAIKAAIVAEGVLYAKRLAGSFDPDTVTNYSRAMAEGFAGGLHETIERDVKSVGAELAVARFSALLESSSSGLGGSVVKFAREEAARQSPGYEQRQKTWIPDTDRHADFAGDTVPIGADWPAGFAPGSAPGCKCTASYQ